MNDLGVQSCVHASLCILSTKQISSLKIQSWSCLCVALNKTLSVWNYSHVFMSVFVLVWAKKQYIQTVNFRVYIFAEVRFLSLLQFECQHIETVRIKRYVYNYECENLHCANKYKRWCFYLSGVLCLRGWRSVYIYIHRVIHSCALCTLLTWQWPNHPHPHLFYTHTQENANLADIFIVCFIT